MISLMAQSTSRWAVVCENLYTELQLSLDTLAPALGGSEKESLAAVAETVGNIKELIIAIESDEGMEF